MEIKVGKKTIGQGHPAYVIAEVGVNHNNKPDQAKELIRSAARAGVDAMKFQNYTAGKLVTKTAPRFWEWEGEEKPDGTQYDSYSTMDKLPLETYAELVKECEKNGVEFLSTPFDDDALDFLMKLGMKAIKVASSDLTDLPFLRRAAKTGVPIFLSTGAANYEEIDEAVRTIENEGNDKIVVMQCTLRYPTDYQDANLRVIGTFQKMYPKYLTGLSDHTLGTSVPPVAVALGARVVEKHYTIDKTLPLSPDHHLSVDEPEMRRIITAIRQVEASLGDPRKHVLAVESETYKYDKRSLVSTRRIAAGTVITGDMLTRKRPGTGIKPKFLETVVGRKARVDIPEDTTITWQMV